MVTFKQRVHGSTVPRCFPVSYGKIIRDMDGIELLWVFQEKEIKNGVVWYG